MTVSDQATGFHFFSLPIEEFLGESPAGDYVAYVPVPVPHRSVLFEILKHELQLPDYFGENWDALEECLNDLSWLKRFRTIKLIHAGLPHFKAHKTGKVSPVIYLGILRDVIQATRDKPQGRLEVYFPESDRDRITQLLASGETGE